jgi:ribosomal protein S18 acetylase RimI-like enzyme
MKIVAAKKAAKKDIKFIKNKLKSYNEQFTSPDNHKELAVFLKDETGKIKGGITGGTYWGWLYIDSLWIDETLRHKGFGRKLLETAEKEAKKRGCENAHLDTHDFQALNFYKKNGYVICGQLNDLPKGYNRYLLKKKLK